MPICYVASTAYRNFEREPYVMPLYVIRMFPGNRIREVRKAAGMSQGELGEAVGLSQGQISNIENGDRSLSLEWMRRIAAALKVTASDLLDEKDNPHRLSESEAALIGSLRVAESETRWMAEASLDAILQAAKVRRKQNKAA